MTQEQMSMLKKYDEIINSTLTNQEGLIVKRKEEIKTSIIWNDTEDVRAFEMWRDQFAYYHPQDLFLITYNIMPDIKIKEIKDKWETFMFPEFTKYIRELITSKTDLEFKKDNLAYRTRIGKINYDFRSKTNLPVELEEKVKENKLLESENKESTYLFGSIYLTYRGYPGL